MKEFVKPTSKQNADAVLQGAKSFDIFDAKLQPKLKDRFSYAVYEDMTQIKHSVSRNTYEITCIDDVLEADTGMLLVGFRKVG